MDIMQAFNDYLPIWSEQKMQPIPTQEHMDRWVLAWKDFQNEYLAEHYQEVADAYKSMAYKTQGDIKREERQAELDKRIEEMNAKTELEPIEEPKVMSEWERVQQMLNEL